MKEKIEKQHKKDYETDRKRQNQQKIKNIKKR
jgi:hypothetical protein